MKWMIASDLHGSYYYAQQLQQAFEREQADRLLFLGDLLYHGPRNDLPREYAPKEVIPLLNGKKEKLLCVRGNCDRAGRPTGTAGRLPPAQRPPAFCGSSKPTRAGLTRSSISWQILLLCVLFLFYRRRAPCQGQGSAVKSHTFILKSP